MPTFGGHCGPDRRGRAGLAGRSGHWQHLGHTPNRFSTPVRPHTKGFFKGLLEDVFLRLTGQKVGEVVASGNGEPSGRSTRGKGWMRNG